VTHVTPAISAGVVRGSVPFIFIGLCPLPAGPGAPLAAALSHQLTVVVCGGPSGPLNCLPVAFVSPVAGLLGSLVPQSLTGAPRSLGAGRQLLFPAAAQLLGCLYFRPLGGSTLTQGYELQFRPLAFRRVKMTVVSDPAKALALAQELSVLLAKGAIEPVDPLLSPGGVLLGVRISSDLGPQRNQQIPEGAAIPYADHMHMHRGSAQGGVVRNRGLEGCLLPRAGCISPRVGVMGGHSRAMPPQMSHCAPPQCRAGKPCHLPFFVFLII